MTSCLDFVTAARPNQPAPYVHGDSVIVATARLSLSGPANLAGILDQLVY